MDMETEARFASVEQQVNILRGVASQQMLHNQETDRHLTMLLGIAKGQESDIRVMQTDISTIKTDLGVMNDRLSRVEARLESIEVQLGMEFAAVNQQLAEIRSLLTGGNQPKPPEP
jgi:chromosome segregation ATPase